MPSRKPIAAALGLAFALPLLVATDGLGLGWRHDREQASYAQLAANRAPYTAGADYPDFSPVVAIGKAYRRGHVEPIGSGTLIAPDLVLTAAHVVVRPLRGRRMMDDLVVMAGVELDSAPRYQVVHIETRMTRRERRAFGAIGWTSEASATDADMNDLALLRLEKPVAGIPPAALPPVGKGAALGDTIYFAGFGENAPGDEKRERRWKFSGKRLAGSNRIDRLVKKNPRRESSQGGAFAIDFDNGSAERNTLDSTPHGAWGELLGEGASAMEPTALEGSPYPGDSGGGAFAKRGGRWYLVGVISSGSGFPLTDRNPRIQYGDIVLFTDVAAHRPWLKKTAQTIPSSR